MIVISHFQKVEIIFNTFIESTKQNRSARYISQWVLHVPDRYLVSGVIPRALLVNLACSVPYNLIPRTSQSHTTTNVSHP